MIYILGLLTENQAWQKLGILAVLGIAVHLILPQITALGNSWRVLSSMKLRAVGLAFLAQGISYLGSGFLLQSILAIAHQKVSLWLNTLIVLGSASIGLVAGGMVGSSTAIYRWTSGGKGNVESAILATVFFTSAQQHPVGTGFHFWPNSSLCGYPAMWRIYAENPTIRTPPARQLATCLARGIRCNKNLMTRYTFFTQLNSMSKPVELQKPITSGFLSFRSILR